MHSLAQFGIGSSQDVRGLSEMSDNLVFPHGQCETKFGERGQWLGSSS